MRLQLPKESKNYSLSTNSFYFLTQQQSSTPNFSFVIFEKLTAGRFISFPYCISRIKSSIGYIKRQSVLQYAGVIDN